MVTVGGEMAEGLKKMFGDEFAKHLLARCGLGLSEKNHPTPSDDSDQPSKEEGNAHAPGSSDKDNDKTRDGDTLQIHFESVGWRTVKSFRWRYEKKGVKQDDEHRGVSISCVLNKDLSQWCSFLLHGCAVLVFLCALFLVVACLKGCVDEIGKESESQGAPVSKVPAWSGCPHSEEQCAMCREINGMILNLRATTEAHTIQTEAAAAQRHFEAVTSTARSVSDWAYVCDHGLSLLERGIRRMILPREQRTQTGVKE